TPAALAEDPPAAEQAWGRSPAAYPVVARLIETSIAAWKRRVAELLAGVARDWRTLGAAGPLIEEVKSHGERLQARRATLSLRLGGGGRWVHREKDLSMAAWLMELAGRLNESLSVPLHVRPIHVRPGYSWDSFVTSGPCEDPAAIRRYFLRAGMLLRLLERLGACDFHMQNVLAAGEYPVLV